MSEKLLSLRAAFYGTGEMNARHLHVVQHRLATPGIEVVGSFSPSGKAWQEPGRPADWGEVRADPRVLLREGRPNMAWVAMPPSVTEKITSYLVQQKDPPALFVEKPIGAGLWLPEQTAQIITEREIPTAVGFHLRAMPHVQETKAVLDEMLTSGEREVSSVHMYWHGNSFAQARPWWRQRLAIKDGKTDESQVLTSQIIEQGVHLNDLAIYLLGDHLGELVVDGGESYYGIPNNYPFPQDVTPIKSRKDVPTYVPTQSVGRAHFDNPTGKLVKIMLDASCVYQAPKSDVGMEIYFDDGSIMTIDRQAMEHTLDEQVLASSTSEGRFPTNDPLRAFEVEDQAFVDSLVHGGDVFVNFNEAMRAQRVSVGMDNNSERVDSPLFVRDFQKAAA